MQRFRFYRATVGALLLLLASAVPMRGQSADERLQQHFEAAQKDQQAGDLDGAAREYQAAIQINPEIAELYANLGLVYYAQSKFSYSAAALATAAKLKPGLPGVTLWRGINDVKLGEPAKAVPLLREAVHETPKDMQAERFYGTALWDSGESFPAIDQMTKTCAMFPSDIDSSFALAEMYRKAANHQMETVLAASSGTPFLHLVYGDIYREQHAWVRASAHYRQAIKQDPASKGAHLGLGEVDLAQNKLTEAEAEFQEELKIDPDSVEATAWLAEIDLFSDRTQAAMQLLKDAIQRSPYRALAAFQFDRSSAASPSATSNASTAQLRQVDAELQSMPESAARSLALAILDNELALPALPSDLKRYQELLPNAPSAQSGFVEAERNAALGRFQPAAQQLRSWLDLHPNDVKARYLFAKVLKQLSLAASDRVIAIDPESPRVHQLMGQIYADRSEEDKALAEYKLVEQSDPALPGIHYEIGHLQWQFGDRDDALSEFHKELATDPYHAEANGEIGSILLVENQPQAAIPYLETALRIDPSLTVAHQQLGKAYVMLKDYKKAEPELEKAAATDLDGSVYYQLWILYRAEGRKDDAARAIEHCQQLRAQNTGEAQNLARGTVAP
ncbi:MAG: tetratricopeptide repeat protein [Silvibacterium sp.]